VAEIALMHSNPNPALTKKSVLADGFLFYKILLIPIVETS